MSALTRGLSRDDIIFIMIKNLIAWGHKPLDITRLPGISESDTKTHLGWLTQAEASGSNLIRIIGANAPTPDRFFKVLNKKPTAGQQGSVSAYGQTALTQAEVNARQAAGWFLKKEGRSISLTANSLRETVGVPMLNGGIYLINVDLADANTYAAELGLMRAATINTETEIGKAYTGTRRSQPAKVRRTVGNGTLTMPCSADKLQEAITTGGWVKVHGEKQDGNIEIAAE